jgi:hypothetical protein
VAVDTIEETSDPPDCLDVRMMPVWYDAIGGVRLPGCPAPHSRGAGQIDFGASRGSTNSVSDVPVVHRLALGAANLLGAPLTRHTTVTERDHAAWSCTPSGPVRRRTHSSVIDM